MIVFCNFISDIIADAINISNALNIYDDAQQQNVNLPVLEAVDANMSNLSITDITVSAVSIFDEFKMFSKYVRMNIEIWTF